MTPEEIKQRSTTTVVLVCGECQSEEESRGERRSWDHTFHVIAEDDQDDVWLEAAVCEGGHVADEDLCHDLRLELTGADEWTAEDYAWEEAERTLDERWLDRHFGLDD